MTTCSLSAAASLRCVARSSANRRVLRSIGALVNGRPVVHAFGPHSSRALVSRDLFTAASKISARKGAQVTPALRLPPTMAFSSLNNTEGVTSVWDAPEISLSSSAATEFTGDLLIVALTKEAKESFPEAFTAVDTACGGVLSELADADFKAGAGDSASVRIVGGSAKRVAVLGLGEAGGLSKPAVWSKIGGGVASLAANAKAASVGLALVGVPAEVTGDKETAAFSTGVCVNAFVDGRYMKEPKPNPMKTLSLMGFAGSAESISEGTGTAAGVIFAKELVNAPPNKLTPEAMAADARTIAASASDCMKLTVLEEKDCEALGMGAYLGVTAASNLPPKFIHLEYTPPGATDDTPSIAIVGKGLTFDSGGYNIKAGAGSMIDLMKFDMGGASATLGCAKAVSILKPTNVKIHFITASCENMVSGTGMRPGDILTASNGRTIEINNTDAEGRLTLCDAIIYAENLGVKKICDIATLTGACIVGLGDDYAGLFTPSDSLSDELIAASHAGGECLWRMPMPANYADSLKSKIADTKNTGKRAGGAISAALFLKEFVKDAEWAHIDMAGPVWDEAKGVATGYGVQTLLKWAQAQ
mmetsp:Transcript_12196/g.44508  ORF Transcript_12196/g.44508 Transcript_12196/m.44508 type:complete len:589 (-) Transcript_12196:461-2227(-)